MPALPTRYGNLSVPDVSEDVIVGFLRRYGEWAWDETRFVADNLHDGARIADIGAFLGTFGLGVALLRRLDFLCFVEPNPQIIPLLRENVERNCEAQSAVVAAAVAPTGFDLSEALYDEGNLGSLSYANRSRSGKTRSNVGPVETVDLASLRRRFGEFDLIKVDAEGLEIDILRSELPSLVRAKTNLWIEANEDLETIELGTMLLRAGIHVHYFAWSSFNPDNLHGNVTAIYPFAYEAGLYASVGDPPVLDDALQVHQPILKRIESPDDLVEALWVTPRWGKAEWLGRTPPEVAALAGRELRGEALKNFPNPSSGFVPSDSPLIALRERLRCSEEALAHAGSLAFKRLAELECQGAELNAARKLLQQRDMRIAFLEEQLGTFLRTLRAMESSPVWRAAEWARRFLSRHPRLRGVLRTLATAAGLIAGHKRHSRG